MAIDQTEKRRALARQCVQTAPLLMNVLYSLDALRVDTATLNAFFAAIPTLLQALQNQGFDNTFEALRS